MHSEIMAEKTTYVLDKASCHAAYTASHVPLFCRITQAVLWFLRSGLAMLLWCLCMLCVGAMRQSHATASLSQPRNRRLLSRTNTTAAELFYLRHMRSCAAAATGNKGGNPSPSIALHIAGADALGALIQRISQMIRDYAKIVMKLVMVSFGMLQCILTWATPLEWAACLHFGQCLHASRPLYILL